MSVDLEKLTAPFPKEAIKQRAGGHGRMLSYVEGFTVIRRLNEACPAWDLAIVREWQDGPLMKAHVRLTIPGLGSREHVGVQVINDRPGTEDVQAKGHITDGLKKAATLFGVGLELYGPDYEAGEVSTAPVTRPAPQPRPLGVQAAGPPPITEPQTRMIHRLGHKLQWSEEELHAKLKVASLHELSKDEASTRISWLKKQAGEEEEPRPQPPRQQPPPPPQEPAHLGDVPWEQEPGF